MTPGNGGIKGTKDVGAAVFDGGRRIIKVMNYENKPRFVRYIFLARLEWSTSAKSHVTTGF